VTYKVPEKLAYRPPNRKNGHGEDTISFNRLILEFVNGHVELKTNRGI
jgi:hypothetical protein